MAIDYPPFDDTETWRLDIDLADTAQEARRLLIAWAGKGGGGSNARHDELRIPASAVDTAHGLAIAELAEEHGLALVKLGSFPSGVMWGDAAHSLSSDSNKTINGAKPSHHSKTAIERATDLKLRTAEEKLRILEVQRRQKEKEVVSRTAVEKAVFAIYRAHRESWQTWSARASPIVASRFGIDPVELAIVLEEQVREHLNDLALAPLELSGA